jgi:predicted O-methyltransferase YrrM
MAERLPDNLALLHEAFSKEGIENLFSGDVYEFDGVEFVCKYKPESTPERFCIVKPLPFIEYFVEFCSPFQGGNLFELGIAEGGSTALLALVTKPKKLVAVDNESQRLDALDEFIANRGLGGSVRPFYGVDQGDQPRLRELVAAEFDGPLDLVLDDASHQLEPTRASFDALFPYLRPGGIYTIEDWDSDHTFRDGMVAALSNPTSPAEEAATARFRKAVAANAASPPPPQKASMSRLAVELLLACASAKDVVAEVTFNRYWIIVRRGADEVDPNGFRLVDQFRDYFGYLPAIP